jgi:FAD/FMN-containing dehydrogenase
MTAARSQDLPIDELIALLGAENVLSDVPDLTFYSTDVYRRADVDAALVVRPGSVEELSGALRLCTERGLTVIPRGGGLSYTAGFLPIRSDSVLVDMRRLDQIVQINTQDMYVTVECGATWKTLYEALQPLGLRTPYFGPMSGAMSTVGGALSQGSVFLGSTQYGSTADTVLSLDVVMADGAVLQTGSAGGIHGAGPFFRNYGPDLAGLFLHDAGAFGFKARATLRLITAPEYSGFASFTFGNYADLLGAMSEVGRRGLAAECYGADPYIWGMRLWDSDLGRDVQRVIGVVTSGRTIVSGIKDAVRIAISGRQALKDVEYAMNIAVDGRSQAEIDVALGEIRSIALEKGVEVEATVPRSVRGTPFLPPNDILGPKGERWAPSHGIAPHSRILEVTDALHAFFAARSDILEQHQIDWGYVAFAISTTSILLEPMLYWPGARELYHERIITPDHLAKLPVMAPAPETAEVMRQLRLDLTEFWMLQGCAHLQIGKTYRYMESRQPAVRKLLEGIKALVDPLGLVNPQTLGFD